MKKLLLTAALLSATGIANASNIVLNGGFESHTCGALSNNYKAVGPSFGNSTCITDWTVGGTSVDLVNGNWGAITGNSIDLRGTPGPGSISQVLTQAESGQQYKLTFDLWHNAGDGSSGIGKQVQVSFGDQTQTFVKAANALESFTWFVSANFSSPITLKFDSVVAGNYGPTLDNVQLSAVPLPAAAWLFGSALVGFMMMSNRRKV